MIPSTGSPCRSSGRKLEEAECEKCDLSCSSRALYAAEHCRWSRRRFCDRIGSRKRRAALRCRLHYTHTFFSPGRNCRPVVVNIVTGAFFRLVIGRVFRKLPGAILRGGIKALTAQGYRIANADRGRSRRLPNAIDRICPSNGAWRCLSITTCYAVRLRVYVRCSRNTNQPGTVVRRGKWFSRRDYLGGPRRAGANRRGVKAYY